MKRNGQLALMRRVPETLNQCNLEFQGAHRIDLDRARSQQIRYASVLESLGRTVLWMDADNSYPDCCYVEDTAVVFEQHVLITRPGSASRSGEPADVSDWFRSHEYLVESMPGNAHLEGGDVLRINDMFFCGQSDRTTDAAGVAMLKSFFRPLGMEVVGVPVGSALHLKTACTYLGRGCILAATAALPDFDAWACQFRVLTVAMEEMPAANVMAFGNVVVMSAGWPRVKNEIAAQGFEVIEVDISEHHKAEAGLTCLSILL